MKGPTEGTRRLSNAEMLAAIDDPVITARTLEYWRHEGLLPKAERTGQSGKRPEWTYPASAGDQLQELLRLRHRTRQPDVLRVALWFRGFPIETGRVQSSIVAVLRHVQNVVISEIEKRRDPSLPLEESTWAALEKVGQAVARKRGTHAPPRYGRQTRGDRERATTLLFGLALGYPEASERVADDAKRVERLIGLDQARRARPGWGAWLSGPASEGLDGFSSVASIPALIEVVDTATEAELGASRGLARTMLAGITAVSRMADAFSLSENATGLAAWEALGEEPMATVWLTALVVSIRRMGRANESLRTVVDALDRDVLPVEQQARELAALPPDELNRRLPHLENMPFIEQARLKRLIAEYRGEDAG